MKKNCGKIYKRKDTRFEGRYIAGYDGIYGKAVYRSVYGFSYEETARSLEEAENNVEEEVELQRILRRQKRRKQNAGIIQQALNKDACIRIKRELTVKEWMLEWLEDHKKNTIRASSYTRYYNIVHRHLIPEIGHYNLMDLSPMVIQELIKYFCEDGKSKGVGLATSTIRSYMVIISAAFEKAIEQGLLIVNPCKGVTLPSKKQSKPVYLEPEECQRLEDVLLKTDDDARSVAILLTLKTGLRLGEIAALQWGDLEFEKKMIRIRHSLQRKNTFAPHGPRTKTVVDETKTPSSKRNIPMTEGVFEYLKMYQRSENNYGRTELQDDSFVFKNQNGDFIDPRVYQKYLKKILKKSGVKNVNFHALRHTFATIAASKNMQISVLSRILGHSNVTLTLQLYVHSVPDQDRTEMEKMEWNIKIA